LENHQTIDSLIIQFHEGTITPEAHRKLLEMLALPEYAGKAEQFLAQVWEKMPAGDPFFTTPQSRDIHYQLMQRIQRRKPIIKGLNSKWVKVIPAAAAILLVISYFFYQQYFIKGPGKMPVPDKQESAMTADIAPGGNKAILKLANHRTIPLDEVKAGVLVNMGSILVKKTMNGQLVFETNPKAGTGEGFSGENILITPAGGQYEIVLADGSRVWLNASSSLKFPSVFNGKDRKVELSGEAYFEVSKVKGQPFMVNAKDMQVEVLGTHFNINAYPDEQYSATTLAEGSVNVSGKNAAARLVPNEQAKISGGKLGVQQVNIQDVLAWKDGYFVFANEDIQSIMRKLSRWYNVQIEYEDPAINEQFDARISKYKNISEVLNVLQATGTINFKILPGQDPNNERRIVVMK